MNRKKTPLVKRDKYLSNVIQQMGRDAIKIVTGIRRCGKSYLLFTLFYTYLRENGIADDQIIQIKLDEKKNEALRNPDALYQYLNEKIADAKKDYFVLLDEAQFAIRKEDVQNRDKPLPLYDILNDLLHRPNVDVYITGSNSKFLSTDVLTEFRGRGEEIHLQPLSFSEFCGAFNGSPHEAWEQYLFYGGMPRLFQEEGDEAKPNDEATSRCNAINIMKSMEAPAAEEPVAANDVQEDDVVIVEEEPTPANPSPDSLPKPKRLLQLIEPVAILLALLLSAYAAIKTFIRDKGVKEEVSPDTIMQAPVTPPTQIEVIEPQPKEEDTIQQVQEEVVEEEQPIKSENVEEPTTEKKEVDPAIKEVVKKLVNNGKQ